MSQTTSLATRPGLTGGLAAVLAPLVLLAATLLALASPWYWLAFVPALAVLGGLAMVRYPVLAYLAILFLIPFGAYRELLGALKLDWILAAGVLLVIAVRVLVERRMPPGLRSPLWVWLGLLLGVYLFSTLGSGYRVTAMENLMLLVTALMFVGISLAMVDLRAFAQQLPTTIMISVSIGSVLAVYGYMTGSVLFADEGFVRGTGASGDPNNLALMVLFSLPLYVNALVHGRGLARRLAVAAMLAVNLAALVTTYSRSGLLALLILLLLLGWEYARYLRPRHIGILLLGISGAVVAAGLLIPGEYWERQFSIVQGQDFAMQRRTSYLTIGWEAFRAEPVLGHGPGTFRDIYGSSATGAAFEREGKTLRRYAHNSYLELLVGTGVVGLGIYLGTLAFTLFAFNRAKAHWSARGRRRLADLTGAYRAGFIIVCIYLAVFSEPLHKYLLLALALGPIALQLSRHRRPL